MFVLVIYVIFLKLSRCLCCVSRFEFRVLPLRGGDFLFLKKTKRFPTFVELLFIDCFDLTFAFDVLIFEKKKKSLSFF
jgi:hypothetical protein